MFKDELCNDLPNAFLESKKHVSFPYEKSFCESQIPTKAWHIQMSKELLASYQVEIQDLPNKKLIRPNNCSWSCSAFYANKASEIEWGTPRLIINYKPLTKVLQ